MKVEVWSSDKISSDKVQEKIAVEHCIFQAERAWLGNVT